MPVSEIVSSRRVAPRSLILAWMMSAMMASTVTALLGTAAVQVGVADGAEAHLVGHYFVGGVEAQVLVEAEELAAGQHHAFALVGEVDGGAGRCSRGGCSATRPARSSWKSGTRARSRPAESGRCRCSTARGAGAWGPTVRSRRARRRCAPWRGPSPRRGGRRRCRRRT